MSIEEIIRDLIAGAERSGERVERQPDRGREVKLARLSDAFARGAAEAVAHFGIKEALWGALAKKVAPKLMGAGKAALGHPMGQMAAMDVGGRMLQSRPPAPTQGLT